MTAVGVPGRGQGSMSVTLQHITIKERELGILREEFGEITLRSAYFEIDYGLTDRLALNVILPYKSNRYVGDQPHDPRLLDNDHGEAFLDDGQYHSNWGDYGVNLRWLWRTNPVAITPFIGYYAPSTNYPLFTETQAGKQQWQVDLGVNAAGRLIPRKNFFWQAGYAYSYMQETRPSDAPARRVNHSRLTLELSWAATPTLTSYLTLSHLKPHNALAFPDEFTGIPYNDQFYYHDQLLGWEYTTWAVGLNYSASERYRFSMSYGKTLDITFGHIYEPALSFTLSRSFSTRFADSR